MFSANVRGFVICEYVKNPALKEMVEMFDCKVHSHQFSVKCTVPCLSRCYLPEKKEMRWQVSSTYWCKTAPTAVLDATVKRHVGAFVFGVRE